MVTSERMKKLWQDPEYRRKQSLSHKGATHTLNAEQRAAISKRMMGNKLSEEARRKISEAHKGNKYNLGKRHTEETKRKLSLAHIGRSTGAKSVETRRKISLKNSGNGNGQWKGGVRPTTRGYIKIHSPNHPNKDISGYVMEHRLIVEKFIGRYLTKEEQIHHIDFNPKNNDISNLMIFPNAKEHIRFHNKLRQFGLTQPLRTLIENRWKEFNLLR